MTEQLSTFQRPSIKTSSSINEKCLQRESGCGNWLPSVSAPSASTSFVLPNYAATALGSYNICASKATLTRRRCSDAWFVPNVKAPQANNPHSGQGIWTPLWTFVSWRWSGWRRKLARWRSVVDRTRLGWPVPLRRRSRRRKKRANQLILWHVMVQIFVNLNPTCKVGVYCMISKV